MSRERDHATIDALSRREIDVLQLAAEGLTNTEVATRLGVTVHAVKFHLAAVYRKLGAGNRTEAAVVYVQSTRKQTAATSTTALDVSD